MGKWGTGKVIKICIQCKKEFYARQDKMGKFCSKSCASKNKPKIFLRINKNCIVCNKEYTVKRYRINSALYCSITCRRKNMPSKENHSNWKGGIARTWKSKVIIKKLMKLKGKCEICNSNKNLQGHHIISYSENEILRENENNIQILCRNCHANKHPKMANFILKGLIHE